MDNDSWEINIEECLSPERVKRAKEDLLLGKETQVVAELRGLILGFIVALIPQKERQKGVTLKKIIKNLSPEFITISSEQLTNLVIMLFPSLTTEKKLYLEEPEQTEEVSETSTMAPGWPKLLHEQITDVLAKGRNGVKTLDMEKLHALLLMSLNDYVESDCLAQGLSLDECVLALAASPHSNRFTLKAMLEGIFPPLAAGDRICVRISDAQTDGSFDIDVNFRYSTPKEKERDKSQSKLQEFIFGAISKFLSAKSLQRGVSKKQVIRPIKDLMRCIQDKKNIRTDAALEFIDYYLPEFLDGRKLYVTFTGPEIGSRQPMTFHFE